MKNSIYVRPKKIKDIGKCHFYHAMDMPGHGVVGYEWDLRGKESQYLGRVNFKNKRVLELGPASGYLGFYMEKMGARVVAFDISGNEEWDIVPMSQYDYKKTVKVYKKKTKRMHNGYWFAHKAFRSKVKVVYGSIYNIPKAIGMVDITTVCAILLHLRDPFLALQKAAKLTLETVIVTDLAPKKPLRYQSSFFEWLTRRPPYMLFLPDFKTHKYKESWWLLSPEIIVNFLGVLGFEKTKTTYHFQKYKNGRDCKFFTVVGKRTRKL